MVKFCFCVCFALFTQGLVARYNSNSAIMSLDNTTTVGLIMKGKLAVQHTERRSRPWQCGTRKTTFLARPQRCSQIRRNTGSQLTYFHQLLEGSGNEK